MRTITATMKWMMAAVPCLLIACGGGGGGSSSAGSAALQQKLDFVEATRAKHESVIDKGQAAIAQEMIAFFRSRPDVRESGVTESGDIWAAYSDGSHIAVVNNRPVGSGRSLATGLSRAVSPRDLPSATKAFLGAPVNVPNVTPVVFDLGAMLTLAKYSTRVFPALKVADLKTVTGAEGFFYVDAHGIHIPASSDSEELIGFTTDDPCPILASRMSPSDAYDMDHDILMLGVEPVLVPDASAPGGSRVVSKAVWTISQKFVTKYMRFASDCLVFVNACHSAESDIFADACFSKGAGAFAGWDFSVDDRFVGPVARRFVDRMLGANLEAPPTPKTRPLDWQSVLIKMISDGLVPVPSSLRTQGTALIVRRNPLSDDDGDYALLAPSIFQLGVDEDTDTLTIDGLFGTRPGVVKINGRQVLLSSGWDSKRLQCGIARSGPDAAGDVVVEVNGRQSNRAQLTMWEGTVHFADLDDNGRAKSADLRFRFRADVRHNLTPESRPLPTTTVHLDPNLDSACTVGVTGYTLNGPSSLPLNTGTFQYPNPDFVYLGRLVPAERKIFLDFEIRGIAKASYGDQTFDISYFNNWFATNSGTYRLSVPMTIGSDYSIQAGSVGDHVNQQITMSWPAIVANHPPDPTAGRAAAETTRNIMNR